MSQFQRVVSCRRDGACLALFMFAFPGSGALAFRLPVACCFGFFALPLARPSSKTALRGNPLARIARRVRSISALPGFLLPAGWFDTQQRALCSVTLRVHTGRRLHLSGRRESCPTGGFSFSWELSVPRVIEIQVHLSGVSVSEFSDLQVDDHQTSQTPVEKTASLPDTTRSRMRNRLCLPMKQKSPPSSRRKISRRRINAFFQIAFRVLVLEVKNSSTNGSLISSSGRTASSVRARRPLVSMAALFFERAVRS